MTSSAFHTVLFLVLLESKHKEDARARAKGTGWVFRELRVQRRTRSFPG